MLNNESLRALVTERDALLAPGVFDGLSAHLTAAAGFPAAYMSGAAVAASATGLPDVGLATQSELVRQATVICGAIDTPVVADADTGFGDVTNTYRTVQLYERAGVAAIQLEDQEFPKRCGHLDHKRVIDAEEFADKVRAAVEARRNEELLIIARTDSRAILGFDEAIRRVNLYADAGADMVFVEAPQTIEEIRKVPSLVPVPALFNFVTRGKTPPVIHEDLREAGYGIVILPGLNIGSAARAMRAALAHVRNGDFVGGAEDSPEELFTSVGMPFWEDLRTRYQHGPTSG